MPNIKILLNEKVEKLGDIGEIVIVKPGYARNYLIPKGLATIPSPGEINRLKKKKELLEKLYQEEKVQAETIVSKLNEIREIVILARSGESGKLFGAITAKDIAEKINEQLESNIQRKQVLLRRSISEIGEYQIKLKLHSEITAQVKVVVKKEESS